MGIISTIRNPRIALAGVALAAALTALPAAASNGPVFAPQNPGVDSEPEEIVIFGGIADAKAAPAAEQAADKAIPALPVTYEPAKPAKSTVKAPAKL
jgi:hypothetical protein